MTNYQAENLKDFNCGAGWVMRFGKKLAKLFCFMNDSSFWLSDFYYRVMGGFTRKYEPSSILTSNLLTNLLLERFLLNNDDRKSCIVYYCVLECFKGKNRFYPNFECMKNTFENCKTMVCSKIWYKFPRPPPQTLKSLLSVVLGLSSWIIVLLYAHSMSSISYSLGKASPVLGTGICWKSPILNHVYIIQSKNFNIKFPISLSLWFFLFNLQKITKS